LSYQDINTLEKDLNYIRSILKQLKGTATYDTPLVKTLIDLKQELENAVFENATLTGTSVSDTPPTADRSTRIATTEYVRDVVDQQLVVSGADARYVHTQGVPLAIWTIQHNLNKFPSVSVVDTSGTNVFGVVKYLDANNTTVEFSAGFAGKAYLN